MNFPQTGPNGEWLHTTDEYCDAWHKAIEPLLKAIPDLRLYGYGNSYSLVSKSNPHLSIDLPTWFVLELGKVL